ncbi:hypothetical protein [Erwinia billingiae]|uniref:hypothetical protein n=1 Tax=Erwinia billingiae TaxID=182337 RepID=UPI0022465885|nr:hypothetical protein [Erwinia billingiae]MCX0498985.1 hypothetical protein [Erwinia billingiae]
MTNAHSAAAIVKLGAEGAAAWLPLLQTLAGGVLAGGVALYVNHRSHKNALEREEKSAAERLRNERQAAEEKLARERYFIGTELVFLLEQFAEGCASVARDNGLEHEHAFAPTFPRPELDYSVITGDWRTLPVRLMYQLRELPVLKSESDRTIGAADYTGPDYDAFFEARQYEYTRLGLKAIILARRLRKLAGFPDSRLNTTPWSAQRVLWEEWRRERKRRTVQSLLHARALAAFQIKNDMRRKASDDAGTYGDNA